MITVFGSLNVDLVVQVPRLPVEGETVLGPDYVAVAGGKGANQALAAARAGAAVRMVGCVGSDDFAELALSSLRAAGVALDAIAAVDARTAVAMIAVDPDGRNQIAVASGANRRARADQLGPADLGPNAILVLQMEIDPAENWRAVARAKTAGARIVLNVAPAGPVPEDVLAALDVLIVNEGEAAELAGLVLARPVADDPPALTAALARAYDLACVMTLGAAGAIAARGGENWRLPALAVEVVDTTAAGDAFVGGLVAALDAGADFEPALRRGIAAGSLACRTIGAQPSLPSRAEIEAALAG